MKKHGKKKKGKKGKSLETPFTAPLTQQSFNQEERAAERQQFKPISQQLSGEARASHLQQQRIGDWFSGYQQNLANIQAQSQQGYQNAQNQFQGYVGQAGQQDESLRAKLAQESQADAARRGVQADYTGVNAFINAANQRQNLALGYQGMTGTQGANQYAYLGDKQRIGEGEKIHQLLTEQNRGRDIQNSLRQLAEKRGDFRTTYRSTARDTERKYLLAKLGLAQSASNAKLSAQTSRANALLSSQTSSANSQRSSATSLANSRRTARTSRQNSRRSARSGSSGGGRSARQIQAGHAQTLLKGAPPGAYHNNASAVKYLMGLGIPRRLAKNAVYGAGGGKHHKKHKKHHKKNPWGGKVTF